jgi:hypothetical protein
MKYPLFILILTGLVISFQACKKDTIFSKDHLDFSTDTVLFDTIFTTVGSTTKRFKIYNNNNAKILVEEIELMGGTDSPFRINVDGVSGVYHEDVVVPKNDSLFIFVEVTLEVNNVTNPLIISDSIRFQTNGLDQYIMLDVWGQDAYFHVNEIVSGTWANDKPHVIYGLAAVGYPGIDSNLNLTIPQGTDIYCHKNSFLYVYKSSLFIQGVLNNEVTFQGDRLESFYDDVSGQWGGVILASANPSQLDYVSIKNSAYGLQCDKNNGPGITLTVNNTIVDNTDFFSFFVGHDASVLAENCLFGRSGLMSTILFGGGSSQFVNCHFVNYWTGTRGGPAFAIKNYWVEDEVLYTADASCTIYNSVFYGSAEDEFVIDSLFTSPAVFDMEVSNCLIKRGSGTYDYSYLQNIIWNLDPLFEAPLENNYKFLPGSPLDNSGSPSLFSTYDIDGILRNISNPDIGCYEKP